VVRVTIRERGKISSKYIVKGCIECGRYEASDSPRDQSLCEVDWTRLGLGKPFFDSPHETKVHTVPHALGEGKGKEKEKRMGREWVKRRARERVRLWARL